MPYDVLSTRWTQRGPLERRERRGGALFQQVAREPRLSDKVAEMMLETILSRRLQVGDRLPSERELGEQFNVSRTVVREAVRALVAKGVIEVRSGQRPARRCSRRRRGQRVDEPLPPRSDTRLREGARGTRTARGAHRRSRGRARHRGGHRAATRRVHERMQREAGQRRARGAGRPRVPPNDRPARRRTTSTSS